MADDLVDGFMMHYFRYPHETMSFEDWDLVRRTTVEFGTLHLPESYNKDSAQYKWFNILLSHICRFSFNRATTPIISVFDHQRRPKWHFHAAVRSFPSPT